MSGAIPLLHLLRHGKKTDNFTYVKSGVQYDTGAWPTAGYGELRHMNRPEIL